MRITLALVVACVACGAAACGDGGDDEAPPTAPAAVEAAWLGRLLGWIEVESRRGTFVDCEAKLSTIVGAAPSRTLEQIAGAAGAMCHDFDGWRSGQAEALRTGDQKLYRDAQSNLDTAQRELRELARRAGEYVPGTPSPTLPRLAMITSASREEPTFAAVATKLAAVPVVVRCWSTSDWPGVSRSYEQRTGIKFDVAGFANPATRAIDLAPHVCATLAKIRYGHGETLPREAVALDVLAHESMHMREDEPTEAETECYAMQRIAATGRLLGMSVADARSRALFYSMLVYPNQLPSYRSTECRPDGALDESPGGSWP